MNEETKYTCDICGYTSKESVSEFPDSVNRCKVCANLAAHGRYFRDADYNGMTSAERNALLAQYDAWYSNLEREAMENERLA